MDDINCNLKNQFTQSTHTPARDFFKNWDICQAIHQSKKQKAALCSEAQVILDVVRSTRFLMVNSSFVSQSKMTYIYHIGTICFTAICQRIVTINIETAHP